VTIFGAVIVLGIEALSSLSLVVVVVVGFTGVEFSDRRI